MQIKQNKKVNLRKEIIESAKEELKKNDLSPELLEQIISLANVPKPKRWPNNSYRLKAFKILYKINKEVIRKWTPGALKKIKKNELFETIDSALEITIENYNSNKDFRYEFKKKLYKQIGKYVFLDEPEVVNHPFVKLIQKVKLNDQIAINTLYRMKRKRLLPEIKHLKISWKDKENIIKLALYNAAKKMEFVGGFNYYAKLYLKGELRNFWKDVSHTKKEYSFGNLTSMRIADVKSIEEFENDTYEYLLEQSNHVNQNVGYLRVDSNPLPRHLSRRISKIMFPEGNKEVYMQKALDLVMLKEFKTDFELLKEEYKYADDKAISDLLFEINDGSASIKKVEQFNKVISTLRRKQKPKISKDYFMKKMYYALAIDFIMPPSEFICEDEEILWDEEKFRNKEIEQQNFSDTRKKEYYELARESLTNYLIILKEKLDYFNILPKEFRKKIISSVLNKDDYFDNHLDIIDGFYLMFNNEPLMKLREILQIKSNSELSTILDELYNQGLAIYNSKNNGVYRPTLIDINNKTNIGMIVNKTEEMFKNLKAKNNSSFNLEKIIKSENKTLGIIKPKKGTSLSEIFYYTHRIEIEGEEEYKSFIKKINEYEQKTKKLYSKFKNEELEVLECKLNNIYLSEENELFYNPNKFKEVESYSEFDKKEFKKLKQELKEHFKQKREEEIDVLKEVFYRHITQGIAFTSEDEPTLNELYDSYLQKGLRYFIETTNDIIEERKNNYYNKTFQSKEEGILDDDFYNSFNQDMLPEKFLNKIAKIEKQELTTSYSQKETDDNSPIDDLPF